MAQWVQVAPCEDPARRRLLAAGAAGLARGALVPMPLIAGQMTAHAAPKAWPRGTVRIWVAYPPGGVSDLVARVLAEQMTQQLGVPVIVDNRPGASGTLVIDWLNRSAPDGQTLAFTAATAVALRSAAMVRHTADSGLPMLAVVPVAGVMRTPILLVGTQALRASNFADLLTEARHKPDGIRWATTGEGTTGHTVLKRVEQAAGVSIVHVPYKGGGQQLTDALAGHFEVLSTNVAPSQIEALREGKFKALAVGAPERLPVLPNVPTLAELGFAQANLDSLFGLFAPLGTPTGVVQRINQVVAKVLQSPEIRSRLLAANNQPFVGTPEAFLQQVVRESGR